jgi:hypothetical protein
MALTLSVSKIPQFLLVLHSEIPSECLLILRAEEELAELALFGFLLRLSLQPC